LQQGIERVSSLEMIEDNGKKGIRLCEEDFMSDLKLQ
jgi:hypothetical protein